MSKFNIVLTLVATLVCSYGCRRDVVEPGPSVPVDTAVVRTAKGNSVQRLVVVR